MHATAPLLHLCRTTAPLPPQPHPTCGCRYTFAAWYKTPWDKIDVDFLVEETKKLAKDAKTLPKGSRNWEAYRLLEEALKAMLTSLPLVQVRAQRGPCGGGAGGRAL